MTTETKTRIITMTNRAPVQIVESEWPEIAAATERPGSFRNGTRRSADETDCYTLRVRQHADGRTLVYGVIDAATGWTNTEDWRGGELVTASEPPHVTEDELIAAIRRVGARMPDSVVRACIADLPPVEL